MPSPEDENPTAEKERTGGPPGDNLLAPEVFDGATANGDTRKRFAVPFPAISDAA